MISKEKQILADHYLDFYRMAYSILGNSSDTEDAVQEALTITMSKPFLKHPNKYCMSVLYHLCAKMVSAKMTLSLHQLDDIVDDEDYAFRQRLVVVKELRDSLTPRANEYLDLYYDQGMTFSQIAEIKGVSDSMVKKIIYKCHEQLRKQLLKHEQEIINIYE